jgi:hypothetical protein
MEYPLAFVKTIRTRFFLIDKQKNGVVLVERVLIYKDSVIRCGMVAAGGLNRICAAGHQ